MTEPLPENDQNDDELPPQDALAVDATPDEERLHGDGDETDSITRSDGAKLPVDPDE